MYKTLIIVLGFMQFASGQTVGNGHVVTKSIKTAAYDRIDVAGSFDVELISGQEGNISITGEENLLAYVEVDVTDGTLRLKTKKGAHLRHSMGKSIHVTVPFESVDGVTLSGSGDVKSAVQIKSAHFRLNLTGSGNITLNVAATDMHATISGSGDVMLKGAATKLDLDITGSGDIDATGFKTEEATAQISGSGDAMIYCTESLTARISGSGDISYKGDPKRKDTKVSGSGSISKA